MENGIDNFSKEEFDRLLREDDKEAIAKTFDDGGPVLFEDKNQGVVIRGGNIFEAPTVKGGKNLIVAMRVINEHMYYAHGDRMKKVPLVEFVRAVMSGDIEPKKAKDIDTGRLSMAIIALDSIVNRRTAEETIKCYGEGAAEQFLRGD